ncbi:hypothetical protein T01_10516 [Trichinella spiralis]|uniref:Uncharacterized protein n=1 Tax=Trichinella spiralis TaxID=6334 RepID=A0A0V0Z350_TRISP|nr:hypothetical protein T01_10516 [Trichinella spiralis]
MPCFEELNFMCVESLRRTTLRFRGFVMPCFSESNFMCVESLRRTTLRFRFWTTIQ